MFNTTIIFLLTGLLLPATLFSQIRLADEKDDTPVPYAHIFLDNNLYTYSDEKGEFTIGRQKFDTLKVVHLSYQTKSISHTEVQGNKVILLQEKLNTLNEVSITATRKSRKYKILAPERASRDFLGKDFDIPLIDGSGNTLGVDEYSETINISRAIYIPNETGKENALITKIILNSVDKEIKGDTKYIPFKVNLMTYDTITMLPKERIFPEDLPVGKKKGEKVTIDLSREKPVVFPKEGICVVVSVYHTERYNNTGFVSPPKFDTVSLKNGSAFREYYSFYSSAWKEQPYSQRREQCFNFAIEIEE